MGLSEICKVYQQTGVCPKRDYCVYAHGKHEMRVKPKCQMCFKWQAGYCPFMDDSAQCVFAHGEDEFRPELTEIYLVRRTMDCYDLSDFVSVCRLTR